MIEDWNGATYQVPRQDQCDRDVTDSGSDEPEDYDRLKFAELIKLRNEMNGKGRSKTADCTGTSDASRVHNEEDDVQNEPMEVMKINATRYQFRVRTRILQAKKSCDMHAMIP